MKDEYIFHQSEIDEVNSNSNLTNEKRKLIIKYSNKYRVIKKRPHWDTDYFYYPQYKFLCFWITFMYARYNNVDEAWKRIDFEIAISEKKKKNNKKEIIYR